MCCRGLLRAANPAYLGGFLFLSLLRVAPYCARGGVKVVSGEVRRQWITRRRFLCNPDPRLGYPRLARCAGRDGDGLPATGRVHARRSVSAGRGRHLPSAVFERVSNSAHSAFAHIGQLHRRRRKATPQPPVGDDQADRHGAPHHRAGSSAPLPRLRPRRRN